MDSKKWYYSWTVWFNILVLVVEFVNQLAQILPVPPGVLTLATGFGNLLLRFKTTSPIY